MRAFDYIQEQLERKGHSCDYGHIAANRKNLKSIQKAHDEIKLAFLLLQTPVQLLEEEFLRFEKSNISFSSQDGLERYLKLDRKGSKIPLKRTDRKNIYKALTCFSLFARIDIQEKKKLAQLLEEFVKSSMSIFDNLSNELCA